MKLLCLVIFLSACVSNKKQADKRVPSQPQKSFQENSQENVHEDLRGLSSLSKSLEANSVGESHNEGVNFIAQQMKKLIVDYERVTKQLSHINNKLDRALQKMAFYELKHLFPADPKKKSTPLEDQIVLRLKNDEELLLRITKQEDYVQLVGQVVLDEFDIDEEEKERVLGLLKKKVHSQDSLEEDPEALDPGLWEEDPVKNQDLTKNKRFLRGTRGILVGFRQESRRLKSRKCLSLLG